MNGKRGSRKFYTCVLPIGVAVLLLIATTTVNRPMPGLVFYENTTFKFMVSVVANEAVDISGQRFWVRVWSDGPKCAAGINFPLPGRQLTIQVLRWSWRG
jgi:hypothetical protein